MGFVYLSALLLVLIHLFTFSSSRVLIVFSPEYTYSSSVDPSLALPVSTVLPAGGADADPWARMRTMQPSEPDNQRKRYYNQRFRTEKQWFGSYIFHQQDEGSGCSFISLGKALVVEYFPVCGYTEGNWRQPGVTKFT
jgi:hypothetical protein